MIYVVYLECPSLAIPSSNGNKTPMMPFLIPALGVRKFVMMVSDGGKRV